MTRLPWRLLENSWVYSKFSKAVSKEAAVEKWRARWQKVEEGDSVLDIGCGTGESLAAMPEVNYLGLDNNAGYIKRARALFGSRGEFRMFDIRADSLEDDSPRDLVLAVGVLHHLNDDHVLRLMEVARKALKPAGRLLTLDGVLHEGQSSLSKLLVSSDRGRFVRHEEGYLKLARKMFPVVRHEILQDMLRVPFSHLVMECRLA